jgi:hypothetical protein
MKRSVRKIRTVQELLDLFEIVPYHGSVPFEKLREELIESRVREATTYLGLLRRKLRSYPSHDNPELFLQLAKDRVSFAQIVGIWTKSDNEISLTDYGRQLKRQLKHHDVQKRKVLLLELLLSSSYVGYANFIEILAKYSGSIMIPRKFQSRGVNFTEFLSSLGFVVEAASFHTIKDFYYDFGFLNWIKTNGDEKIFFTRDLHKYTSVKIMKDVSVKLSDKIPDESVGVDNFRSALVDAFRNLNYEKDGYYDIIRVRDEICQGLRLSDTKFAELVLQLYRKKRDDLVSFSVGPLVEHPQMGYSKKLSTLPRLYDEDPITKIMVKDFGI